MAVIDTADGVEAAGISDHCCLCGCFQPTRGQPILLATGCQEFAQHLREVRRCGDHRFDFCAC